MAETFGGNAIDYKAFATANKELNFKDLSALYCK